MLPQQKPPRNDPDSDREVFRGPGSIVLSWAWLIVAVITLIDLAVQGRNHYALVTAFIVIAITTVVYGCAWRPRIVADADGVTVANPLRDHWVPWLAVTNVDVVHSVRVHCAPAPGSDTGKIIYSWAVQASPSSARRAARRAGLSGQRPRLTMSRNSQSQRPPGSAPGYGQIPEPARDALDRTSAEFTAARLAERAQHARQASLLRAQREADQRSPDQPAVEQQVGDQKVGDQKVVPAAAGAAASRPVATWAWGPIAAMVASVLLVIIILLV